MQIMVIIENFITWNHLSQYLQNEVNPGLTLN